MNGKTDQRLLMENILKDQPDISNKELQKLLGLNRVRTYAIRKRISDSVEKKEPVYDFGDIRDEPVQIGDMEGPECFSGRDISIETGLHHKKLKEVEESAFAKIRAALALMNINSLDDITT